MVEAEFNQIWQQLEHEASHEADPAARARRWRAIAPITARSPSAACAGPAPVGDRPGEWRRHLQPGDEPADHQAAMQYRPADREKFVNMFASSRWPPPSCARRCSRTRWSTFLFGRAEITDRTVSREHLQSEIESEEGVHVHGPGCGHDHDHDHGHDHVHAAEAETAVAAEEVKPKKSRAKTAAPSGETEAAPAEASAEAEAAAPAKKPRARKVAAEPAGEAGAEAEAPAAPKKGRGKKQD
jgi:trigger factor